MTRILVLHGPNLNLLGMREPNVYGDGSLAALNHQIEKEAGQLGLEVEICQSNAEHILIDRVQQCAGGNIDFIIINPAGYTHTSVALRDALLAIKVPFIEVHLSNIYRRETFRHHSYFSDIAVGTIAGLGQASYLLALHYVQHHLTNHIRKE